jgi:two-component system response regulator HydG
VSAKRTRPRVVVVDDDESLRTVLEIELERMGFRVEVHATAEQLAVKLAEHPADVLVLDLRLPGIPGMEALASVLAADPDLPVVVFTAHGSVETAVAAMRQGAFDFLTKPVALDVLEQTLWRAATTAQLRRENRRLKRLFERDDGGPPIQAASPAARQLELAIERVAQAQQCVLVLGESGTGKELVARHLHALGPRHEQPFVVVNCGAMSRALLESELFGHVKGSFTGADRKRLGLFEAADGGTLFLDEIGELAPELQPALLRALQFGEIRPVGSDTVRHVDVRVVAATHRDLRAMAAEGRFRDDLYYRLAVLELRVPPLRERREDIGALAQWFLAREASRGGRALHLTPAAIERLQRHAWPGNVRELENAMVRLAVLAPGPEIGPEDVAATALGGADPRAAGALPTLALRELEQLAIAEAMRQAQGNKRKAAELLGIALKTLYNKLAEADSPPPDG